MQSETGIAHPYQKVEVDRKHFRTVDPLKQYTEKALTLHDSKRRSRSFAA